MRKATIPIDDYSDHCTEGFVVEYKLTGATDYIRLFPDPLSTPIVLTNLNDDAEYNVRVKRKCCDTQQSAWTNITIDTAL
jgi:hypothetical protein